MHFLIQRLDVECATWYQSYLARPSDDGKVEAVVAALASSIKLTTTQLDAHLLTCSPAHLLTCSPANTLAVAW